MSNFKGELLRKQDVYNKLHALGGCDISEEWARGWDIAITAMIDNLGDLPVIERGYKLKICPFCGGNAAFKIVDCVSSAQVCRADVKIACSKCDAEAQPGTVYPVRFRFRGDGTVEALTENLAEAADRWNRRSYEGLYDGKFSEEEDEE